jgi:peptidoglycan/LPS O-acetylase OafA/YrhL
MYSLHLDIIRGFAALLVLVGHLRLIITGHTGAGASGGGLNSHPANATGLGHASVMIFFVLSGYLVGGSVLRDLRRNTFSWSQYGLKRLTRLWTVLVPVLVLSALLDALTMHYFSGTRVVEFGHFTHSFQQPGILQFLRYLAFLQSINRFGVHQFGTNGALWSLSNEFWYYALFPLIAVALGKRSPILWKVLMLFLAGLLLWILGAGIVEYFPLWLCGVAAYIAPPSIPARLQRFAAFAMTLQFLIVLFLMRSLALGGLRSDMCIALSFTVLLYTLLHRVGPASTSLYSHFAHAVSFPSYSLYACHVPACIFLAAFFEKDLPALFRNTALASAATFAVVTVYAGVIYLLFERNTDRIRSRIESGWLRDSVSASSA